jgi:hypothetical protein
MPAALNRGGFDLRFGDITIDRRGAYSRSVGRYRGVGTCLNPTRIIMKKDILIKLCFHSLFPGERKGI